MDKEAINVLRGLAFQYCNEPRNTYIGGQTIVHYELNKNKFEQLSGFVNWIEPFESMPPKPKSKKVK